MGEKKDAYYFNHDANARNDPKILRLRMRHGMEGYSIYFMLIEIMREQSDYRLLLKNLPQFAYDIRCADDTLQSVINDFDLFIINEKYFSSNRLDRNMAYSKSLIEKRKEAGRKGGLASVKQRLGKAKATVKQPSTNAQALNEMKLNEKKRVYQPNSDELRLANLLFELLQKRGQITKPPNLQDWADDINKIIRIDKQPREQVLRLIEWSQADDFWRKNIKSPAKLRKQFLRLLDDAEGQCSKDGVNYPTPNNEDEFGNSKAVA